MRRQGFSEAKAQRVADQLAGGAGELAKHGVEERRPQAARRETSPRAGRRERSESDSGVTPRDSARVRPRSCSVSSDAHAIAVVQPRHRNRASAMRPAFHANSEPQNVAAHRVADFDRGVCARQFARIARIAKMIEHCVAKHRKKYRNPARSDVQR